MDINQAALGLDMRSASRIYFINPVLNPQIEAQAIGRARRISQQKPVTVETLVLRGSLEEVIVRRREEMTAEEQRKCRTILDDKPIYEWILNARILTLPKEDDDDDRDDGQMNGNVNKNTKGLAQTARLKTPQLVFGRGFGRTVEHPDDDLVVAQSPEQMAAKKSVPITNTEHSEMVTLPQAKLESGVAGIKRRYPFGTNSGTPTPLQSRSHSPATSQDGVIDGSNGRPARRVRFASGEDND
jgi:hypothetical protein